MVEKIVDYFKELPPKIKKWWDKFSSKKKTAIISVAVGIIVAFAILITVVTRTQYVTLVTCDNTSQAATVKDLLAGSDIDYKVSDSGLVFSVDRTKLSDANLLLGSNNILTDPYSSLDDVVSGGLSTTESDKQKLYTAYIEGKLTKDLENISFVDKASVTLHIPEDDGTLIAKNEESGAQIMLKLNSDCTPENALTIARAVKTAIGNKTTDNIVIMDTDGNMLFAGGEENSMSGYASNQLDLKQEAEATVKSEIKRVLLNTNQFDLIEVATALTLDFSTTEKVTTHYTPAEGQTQGVLSHETGYEAETEGGSGLVPGTDSNVEQTYVYESGNGGSSNVSQFEKDYLPNTETTTKSIPAGLIVYDESSLAVTAIKYNVLKEEDAKRQGLLDGTTWDDYKLEHSEKTKLEVDEDMLKIVSDASGIDTANITMLAYEEPFFVDKELANFDLKDILQIVLVVVIIALLAYVVIRSLKTEKQPAEEQPEELSVENLLQSMPSEQLEDVDFEAKSETRKMIEKFVDENPEAVANLLRNWLNEDWG